MTAPKRTTLFSLRLLFIVAAVVSFFGPLDYLAGNIVENLITRAQDCFTTGQSLNAAVSVAQETRVMLNPGGLGIIVPVGQALDAKNDLVEQFSSAMLSALIAGKVYLFLISLLTTPVIATGFSLILFLLAFLAGKDSGFSLTLLRAGILLVLIRFVFPFALLLSSLIHNILLEDRYQQSATELKAVVNTLTRESKDLVEANSPAEKIVTQKESSYLDSLVESFSSSVDSAKSMAGRVMSLPGEAKAAVADFLKTVDAATGHIFVLLEVFIIDAFLLPWLIAFLLWCLVTRAPVFLPANNR